MTPLEGQPGEASAAIEPGHVPRGWRPASAPEALRALAQAAGYAARQSDQAVTTSEGRPDGGASSRSEEAVSEAVFAAADRAGLDAELIDLPSDAPLPMLSQSAPALVSLPGAGGLLGVLSSTARTIVVVGPGGLAHVSTTEFEAAVTAEVGGEVTAATWAVLGRVTTLSPSRRHSAARILLAPSRAGRPAVAAWIIRPISGGMKADLRQARVHRRVGAVIAAYLVQFSLFVAIWQQVGARTFDEASAEPGATGGQTWWWFAALLTTWAVVQLLASAAVGKLALDIGAVVRSGLLRGALRLDPGRIRAAGVGQLLGRALDADALDVLALGGGVEAAAALFELGLGGFALGAGAAPGLSLAVMLLALAAIHAFGRVHARRLSQWSRTRRALTHDLVERMVGHRTVLVQDRPGRRMRADDADLTAYDDRTRALDRAEIWLAVVVPRAWLLLGLLVLAPVTFAGEPAGAALAVSLGGVWLVYGALRRLGSALPLLSLAREAWQQLAPLVGAAEPAREAGAPLGAATETEQPPEKLPARAPVPLLVVDNVSYRYPGRADAVLSGVSLTVAAGDRVLVEGASGGGKSTLAGLVTGLKTPSSGGLRLRGVDQAVLGMERWRTAIGGAPQFHDNHVFGTNLMFNVLMGRRWPPRLEDVVAAEGVCRDLGLGPLLDRMPGGLQQQVGETGWQLSHGERSRIFIARSLLQLLQARVLDESFAALDPQTLDQVIGAVLERPEALIVIAHP